MPELIYVRKSSRGEGERCRYVRMLLFAATGRIKLVEIDLLSGNFQEAP